MVVFKVGGSLHGLHKRGLVQAIKKIHHSGEHVVIVHGGGPAVSRRLQTQGIQVVFRDGHRLTSPDAMPTIEQVLSHEVNGSIVDELTSEGFLAEGVAGSQGIVFGVPLFDGTCTGRVVYVDPIAITRILRRGCIPVISPVGSSEGKGLLNINADAVAGAIAGVLGADRLVFLTDVDGIYSDWDQQILLTKTTCDGLTKLLSDGVFSEGMIPKTEAVLFALKSGVPRVYVIHGGKPEHVLWSVDHDASMSDEARNFGTVAT